MRLHSAIYENEVFNLSIKRLRNKQDKARSGNPTVMFLSLFSLRVSMIKKT